MGWGQPSLTITGFGSILGCPLSNQNRLCLWGMVYFDKFSKGYWMQSKTHPFREIACIIYDSIKSAVCYADTFKEFFRALFFTVKPNKLNTSKHGIESETPTQLPIHHWCRSYWKTRFKTVHIPKLESRHANLKLIRVCIKKRILDSIDRDDDWTDRNGHVVGVFVFGAGIFGWGRRSGTRLGRHRAVERRAQSVAADPHPPPRARPQPGKTNQNQIKPVQRDRVSSSKKRIEAQVALFSRAIIERGCRVRSAGNRFCDCWSVARWSDKQKEAPYLLRGMSWNRSSCIIFLHGYYFSYV